MKNFANYLCPSFLVFATWTAAAAEPASGPNQGDPNLVGQVSARLLSDHVNRSVTQGTYVSENVLGTVSRGTVNTQGQIFPQLVPSADRGVVQLRFSGTSNSPGMVGQNGPATIYSSSVTSSQMWKTIFFDEQGIRHLATDGDVQTRLSVDVAAKRRLVERIAQRRANGSRGAAQAITSQRTKDRLAAEINREAKEPLTTLQDYFVHSFQEPLRERGALPKLLKFSTTSDHLRLVMHQAGRSPMSAPASTPPLAPKHDLAFALHESFLGSLFEVFYAGEKVRDKDFLQTMDTLTGEEPSQLRVESGMPRWSVTMADKRPLDLSLDGGTAAITLHLKSVRLGKQEFSGRFSISVRYQIEKSPSGPRLSRQGELTVDGKLDVGSPDELEQALTLLRDKFPGVFQSTLTFDKLAPPSDELWVKLGKLLLVQLEAEKGWLVAGYQLPRTSMQTKNVQLASKSTADPQFATRHTVTQPKATLEAPREHAVS